MEAPEKIYLQQNTTTDCYEEWWPEWFEARAKDTDIEYIRADALIDKACEFLKDKGNGYISIVDGQLVLRKGMIKDFIKYMQGE